MRHMFPQSPQECPRCGDTDATLFHVTWECPPLLRPWQDITALTAELVGRPLSPTPASCLLGIRPHLKGKAPNVADTRHWIRDMLRSEAEVLHSLRDRGMQINGIDEWDALIESLKTKDDTGPP
ncbi:hypothetical protein NDU88_007362 [Pleurodeles waltl]|uniref:Reverse transcriptase zinc-binding domain-containing protein n=1 Tax=Pleurodeles waltl TaxID=8319 RepID=A0AAV7WG91_PLEWA|nr:hypothetical protein NDU88_007362 [Pleurodeles waltl]